jgi:hypothetical protein
MMVELFGATAGASSVSRKLRVVCSRRRFAREAAVGQ